MIEPNWSLQIDAPRSAAWNIYSAVRPILQLVNDSIYGFSKIVKLQADFGFGFRELQNQVSSIKPQHQFHFENAKMTPILGGSHDAWCLQ